MIQGYIKVPDRSAHLKPQHPKAQEPTLSCKHKQCFLAKNSGFILNIYELLNLISGWEIVQRNQNYGNQNYGNVIGPHSDAFLFI